MILKTRHKKWIVVFFYITCIFLFTPYLPQLIRVASSRWSTSGVARFVLSFEIAIALLIFLLALKLLIIGKKKSILFIFSVGAIFLLSLILYKFLPNPYEFTHLPEYAVLSILIVWTLEKEEIKDINKEKFLKSLANKNPYFLSGVLTGIIGTVDEAYQYILPNRFFTLYDIFLNILGGIIGLLVFWGIKR